MPAAAKYRNGIAAAGPEGLGIAEQGTDLKD
jgi:hypothetical protein